MASEAVRLFIERAMAVRPDFALTPENAPRVAEIVRRLDGLPLAIELAAARIRLFTPAAMAERLGDRLALLGAGGRDLPERQRTLRGAIAWSYELIEPRDRILFARVGVFAGGATLEVAEAVCALPDDADPLDVLDGVDRLAEQSLLRIESDRHGDVRFVMLETIRDYALERLVERAEATVLRDRHADAFITLARSGDGPGAVDRATWLDRMADDHDNLRAALDFLVASGDRRRAADLANGTWRFWQMRGHIVEGRKRVDAVLAMPGWTSQESSARLRALEAAGGLAYWAGDMAGASLSYEEAESEARRLGDERELANALYNRFFAQRATSSPDSWIEGLVAKSQPFLTEALEIWTRLGDKAGRAKTLWALCEHHAYRRETTEAEAAATEALALFEELGDGFWVAWARFMRGFTRTIVLDDRGAAEDVSVALGEFRRTNDTSGVALVLAAMATILLIADRLPEAYEMAGASRRLAAETGVLLATMWPRTLFQAPDEDTTDPALRAALETGAAWTTEAATDRAQLLGEELATRSTPA
jgi:tetratricopeptide (TPR) repeat protein